MRSNTGKEEGNTFDPTSTMKKSIHFGISAGVAACLAGALVLGSAAVASASPRDTHAGARGALGWRGVGGDRGRNRPAVEAGTVSTAPGSTAPTTFTMSVKGQNGTTTAVTVDVSSSTKLNEPGLSSAALANIVVGDRVLVVGTQAGTSTVDATWVTLPEARSFGAIATAPGSSAPTTFTMKVQGFSMTGTSGAGTATTVTVDVSTSTKLRQLGKSSPALSSLVAGTRVAVEGTQNGANTISATKVVRFPANTGHNGQNGHNGRGFFGQF